MFENTYLVTDKLETFMHEDVDAAEAALGTRFPDGYREYVTTLGKGEYCDFVWMYAPLDIVESRDRRRLDFKKYAHNWEDGFDILSRKRLTECIVFGASIESDLIAFHPEAPEIIYEFPLEDSTIFPIGVSVSEALAWYRRERLKISRGYFDSGIDQQGGSTRPELKLSLKELRDWLVALGGYDHLEEKWSDTSGVSLETHQFLDGQMGSHMPKLSEVMVFYQSFSGYVSAYAHSFDRVNARLRHDKEKNTELMQKILEYLRSKAA